ncbi:lysylphosphatidylglycerol synthase transmembrane domain-containing protein [Rossellomorea sp. AcN35-11]|nr:flippase-like domain-containing protein [Rossellomorea aquimaris]WJV27847.1 lysylphosphatidylglycerol synthase transmembrane domain-containing protein [Rossellomorea sp. AcN35-11]
MKNMYKSLKYVIGIGIVGYFIWFIATGWNHDEFRRVFSQVLLNPFMILSGISIYGFSFYLKGMATKRLLDHKIRLSSAMYGLWYSLALNHLLPIKGGDVLRSYILYEREGLSKSASAQSVIIVRLMDILSLCLLVGFGMSFISLVNPLTMKVMLVAGGITIPVLGWIYYIKRSFLYQQWTVMLSLIKGKGFFPAFFLVFISWILEAALLLSVCIAANIGISAFQGIWVNSLTILGQVFQITPGGLANYETIMSFGLSQFSLTMETGMAIAVLTHGIKFVFSYSVGLYALVKYPVSPALIQKLRKRKGGA